MDKRTRPQLYTIPNHRAFADALASGLIDRFGSDQLTLARGLVLLPNNRAKRSIADAFVRASGGALLMPRLIAIGDAEPAEAIEAMFEAAADADPPPRAVAPLTRRLLLARLVAEEQARSGAAIDAAQAMRLATELARTLDQLLVEEIAVERLRAIELDGTLSEHWARSLQLFGLVLDRWPEKLAARGEIDLAQRRALLMARLGTQWLAAPPAGFVCAAGITTAAPAVARLLRAVLRLPAGMVVLPGLATDMAEAEWQALGPHLPDATTGLRRRSIETHPQFQLKLLLDRIGVNRGESEVWPGGAVRGPAAARVRAVANALAPAEFTAKWTSLPAEERRLSGVRLAEFATPADEAQGIALALRGALEVPGRTAALVTPDRALARRVAAHCARWGLPVDDSAGVSLSILPPGTLLIGLADLAAQSFAPLALLALLKHPLVQAGEGRLAWLDGVRLLDLALRGPRPAPGLDGIDAHLAGGDVRERIVRRRAARWWEATRPLLGPIAALAATEAARLGEMVAALRDAAQLLCGDALWSGPAGRATAAWLADLEAQANHGPDSVSPADLPALLRLMLDEIAVRPPQGGHPRLAIWGLIEARLQTTDLMILGGLNEGVWPAQPAPDPWLAPRIRSELGLPGLDRRIGTAAHDFAQALGAPDVLLTRARRDAKSPTIPSRFLLRLQALAGGLPRDHALEDWVRAIDDPGVHRPVSRPAPSPIASLRPKRISVTEVDRLKADPYAFYARSVLGLAPLDPVDADPSAAWRGTAVHAILEAWAIEDACAADRLEQRAMTMLGDARTHPMMRALWQPRLMEAIAWLQQTMFAQQATGRRVIAAERAGRIEIAGVTLTGKADRIDRAADGALAIVDYKTGKPPSVAAVRAGFSLQLGLLGLIAERGGFDGIAGHADEFEYWSLAKHGDGFGRIVSPVDREGRYGRIPNDDFTAIAAANLNDAIARWLTGDEPFTAKLVPEYAPYTEYDQVMRRDEWYGRE